MSDEFLKDMLVATKLGILDLDRLIRSAPKRYKVYQIDKRNGGKRTIAHPSKELKVLQRLILQSRLTKLPVHPDALAYVPGRSIRDNAERHKDMKFLLKLDFEDFFPSIKVTDWDRLIGLKACRLRLDLEDRQAHRQILFWGAGESDPHCLSIGAPTSPAISNIIMMKFDKKVRESLKELTVNYSRYADDITLSANDLDTILLAEKIIGKIVARQRWPKLKLNVEKRGLFTKGVRQMVTGLVVTPEGKVSIGRERKRLIHAMMHRYSRGMLDKDDSKKLQGFIGFCIANEPDFVQSLRTKYGAQALRRAQQRK